MKYQQTLYAVVNHIDKKIIQQKNKQKLNYSHSDSKTDPPTGLPPVCRHPAGKPT